MKKPAPPAPPPLRTIRGDKTIKKTISVSEVIADTCLEVTITGVKTFKIRMYLGMQLLKLAAWVIGCQIELSINEK